MVSAAGDTIVVAYESATYPPLPTSADIVWLGSLESLEVRLEPVNTWAGFVVGAVMGAVIGTVAVGFAGVGSVEGEFISFPPWWLGAPVGALLGGAFGAAFAHDRGTRWKRIPLPHIEGAETFPRGPLHTTNAGAGCRHLVTKPLGADG